MSGRLLEPDLLVLAALRVDQQREQGHREEQRRSAALMSKISPGRRPSDEHERRSARGPTRPTPSFQPHLCSLAMPRPAQRASRPRAARPMRPDRSAQPEQPEDRVEVEQEHRDLQRLGLRRVRPAAELRMADSVAGVVLAAGAGTRLRPLTRLRPKALCPVDNVALVDHAHRPRCDRVTDVDRGQRPPRPRRRWSSTSRGAGPVHVSIERERALGTAGALGLLRDWIDGRPVLVVERRRLAARRPRRRSSTAGTASGSGCWSSRTGSGPTSARARYCGVALLPWSDVAGLEPQPSGLYEVSWRDAFELGPARPRRPRRPVRRLRHARRLPARPTCWRPAARRCRTGRARSTPARSLERSVVWAGAVVRAGRAPRRRDPRRRAHRARPLTRRLVRSSDAGAELAHRGGPQLAAGGVDVGAAVAADGGVDAELREPVVEGADRRRATCPRVGVAGRRVQRDEVHVRAAAGGRWRPARAASARRSFTPSISAHSNESRRLLAATYAAAGVGQHRRAGSGG